MNAEEEITHQVGRWGNPNFDVVTMKPHFEQLRENIIDCRVS